MYTCACVHACMLVCRCPGEARSGTRQIPGCLIAHLGSSSRDWAEVFCQPLGLSTQGRGLAPRHHCQHSLIHLGPKAGSSTGTTGKVSRAHGHSSSCHWLPESQASYAAGSSLSWPLGFSQPSTIQVTVQDPNQPDLGGESHQSSATFCLRCGSRGPKLSGGVALVGASSVCAHGPVSPGVTQQPPDDTPKSPSFSRST